MLEFHNPIPQIAGQMCTGLAVQEYRYREEVVDAANVLFVRLGSGPWHRLFIDAGVVFWKTVDVPDPPPADREHSYVITDGGIAHGFVGNRLSGIRTADLPDGGEVCFEFQGGGELILRNVHDRSELVVHNVRRPANKPLQPTRAAPPNGQRGRPRSGPRG